jgi:concanavalin A-like lectin/glucanase superfamily protein
MIVFWLVKNQNTSFKLYYMKAIKLNIKMLSYLAAFLMVFTISACDDDDKIGSFETVSLEALITEAQGLIANGIEGTSPGDLIPGSKAELQEVLTWVDWQIANAESQDEISNAASRLQKYIDKFRTNTVSLAIPIFNKTNGSYIQISDNIKPLLADNFTIEIESYSVGAAWIETMFSAGEGDSGSAFGFNLRFFDDRLDLVVGAGSWNESYVTGGQGMKIGEWVHYAITKSGTEWKVYMDGVEIISEANFPAETTFNSEVPFCLGESYFWNGRAWNGMLRDFRVWSEVRTADQLIANKDEQLEGTEAGLEVYFPLDADLGTNFSDNTGNYTAKFVGSGVAWAPDGIPPVIELVFTSIDAAIADATALKGEVVEGTEDGDFPMGTIMYLQSLIDDATELKGEAEKQDEIDAAVESIKDNLKLVKKYLVADTEGVYVDRENPDAIGLQITPNYTPQGDYTVEFDLNMKTLFMESGDNGEIFGNGTFGLRVYGYNELTESAILNSGGLWNFTDAGAGWGGPRADALTIKSDTWQHVAIVHDQTALTTTIFVDGVEVGTVAETRYPNESGWGEIWLGNSWGGKMNGSIKDFRIWDVVRDTADLNADIDGSETGLHMYFPLDKVAGVKFPAKTGDYSAKMRGIEWNK